MGLSSMDGTYQRLAQQALDLYHDKQKTAKGPIWIAVTGGPGSGKSTLTEEVVNCISSSSQDVKAVCIPMDGYHYSKAELADRELDIRRRGDPWTFDAPRLCQDLSLVSDDDNNDPQQNQVLSFAIYCRKTSDPIPNQIQLDLSQTDIVFVEGNYLTLGQLLANKEEDDSFFPKEDHPPNDMSWIEECQRWKPLLEKWDQTWFITVDPEIQRQRLIARHLQTWTPEKTIQWNGNTDEEAATIRTDFNDVKNAKLINLCQTYAHTIIPSV